MIVYFSNTSSICIRSLLLYVYFVFFFKQKTAYVMRISDWSSDVCSSDLVVDLTHSDDDVVHVLTRCRSDEVLEVAVVGPRPPGLHPERSTPRTVQTVGQDRWPSDSFEREPVLATCTCG